MLEKSDLRVETEILCFRVINQDNENYRKLPGKTLEILLTKPDGSNGEWALPGGAVGSEESLETAAARLLGEETGIDQVYMEQLYTWDKIDRNSGSRVISCSYLALVGSTDGGRDFRGKHCQTGWYAVSCRRKSENRSFTADGSVTRLIYDLELSGNEQRLTSAVEWIRTVQGKKVTVDLTTTGSEGLDPNHSKIIQYGIQRLRSKIGYTDLAFYLVPGMFTLTELQQVYETILDKPLLKANFRRKIASMVTETDQYERRAGHRPSRLYRPNPERQGQN
ncbi:MAG TPA: NUDIX domain-containing protein [Clostridia bacterium]|nr:NUDIX domain-containing protein [Clostridia bacterium]